MIEAFSSDSLSEGTEAGSEKILGGGVELNPDSLEASSAAELQLSHWHEQ